MLWDSACRQQFTKTLFSIVRRAEYGNGGSGHSEALMELCPATHVNAHVIQYQVPASQL
jgi:hypothetical protein